MAWSNRARDVRGKVQRFCRPLPCSHPAAVRLHPCALSLLSLLVASHSWLYPRGPSNSCLRSVYRYPLAVVCSMSGAADAGDGAKEQSIGQQTATAASQLTESPSSITALPPSTSTHAAPTCELRLSNVLACTFPDDLTRHILQLLQPFASTPHLELEGKLGRCVLPATQHKPTFPSLLDCLLPLDPSSSQHVFEAAVPQRVFRHLNDGVMKGRMERELEDSRRDRRLARLAYSHPVTFDLFYDTSPQATRVSVDPLTGSRLAVHKRKLASVDFLSPPLTSPTAATAMPPSIDFRPHSLPRVACPAATHRSTPHP